MNVFKTLSQRVRIMIVASSLFLVTLSLGILVFGHDSLTHENDLMGKAKNATRADMLYIHPTDGGH